LKIHTDGRVESLLHNQSPAHDFQHILRVCINAEMICKKEEGADSDIVLSAALLHDLIVYPKRSNKTLNSADDSAEIAQKILSQYNSYPTEKIEKVADAIRTHSIVSKPRHQLLSMVFILIIVKIATANM
jgi:uncharacterized protein